MKDEECAKLIDERVKDVAHYANHRIEELNAALEILAKSLASRFVDPPGMSSSDYPKWSDEHTNEERLEMRAQRWVDWALKQKGPMFIYE